MKLINETQHLFFFFDVELWVCENLIGQFGWLSLFSFFFFFFFLFLSFLNLAAHTLCSLASYTPALINFFFFFLGPVVQPQQCLCVVCLWVVCCVFVCYKCFCFWWCVCVLGWACCILFGLDFFKAQKLWMDFEVIHCSTWAWASHITQVSILELKLGKKQFKKILKII